MQEAHLLNITNQACALFNDGEVGFLWISIEACFMSEISCLYVIAFSFILLGDYSALSFESSL